MLEQYIDDPEVIVTDISRRLDRGDTSHIKIQDPVAGDPIPNDLLGRLDSLFAGHSEPSHLGGLTLQPGAITAEKRGEIIACLQSLLDAGADISVQANP